MGDDGINIKLGLQGDRELKSGLAAVNSEMRNLDSQMKLAKTVFADSANSSEALKKKIEILSKEYSAQEQKIKLQNKQLENSKSILKDAENNVSKYENALEEAKSKLEALSKSENASKEDIKEQSKAVKEAEEKLQKANIQYNNAQKAVTNYQSDITKSKIKLENLNKELEQNKKYLKEAEDSTDKTAKSIDEYGNEVKDAEEKTSTFGEVLKANLASDAIEEGISTIKDSLVQLGQIVDDLGTRTTKAANNFAAQTGASDEELQKFKKTMQDIYADNFGESMDDISSSMATIKQNINDISPENLKKTTENAILLRDTFGFETEESIRAVKMLMDTFGTSAEEAYSMIAQGAQSGLNKNDDLLDTINEYSVQFKKSGYSAENMFNMLVNGAKKGTFSVDKLGDAVKEFGIRASDGTADEAFKKLGLDAEKIKRMFNEGGDSAKKASQTVMAAYSNMTDSSEKYLIGQQMFGTMFEDLGADAIESLMKVDGQVKNSTDTLKQINDIKYDDFDTTLEGIGRTISVQFGEKFTNSMKKANGGLKNLASSVSNGEIKREIEDLADSSADLVTSFINFGIKAVPYITKGFNFISEHSVEVKSGLTGIATAMITYKAATAIEAVVTSFKALKTAVNGAKTAQEALNIAGKANPFGLVAGLVAGAVTAIGTYIKANEDANDSNDNLVESMKSVKEKCKEVDDAFKSAKNTYKENEEKLQGNVEQAKAYETELYKMTDAQRKSSEGQDRANYLIKVLNDLLPEANLKLDEKTGKLNKQKAAIDDLIISMQKQQKQAILADLSKDYYAAQAKAVKNYTDSQEKQRKKEEQLEQTKKKLTEAEKQGNKELAEHNIVSAKTREKILDLRQAVKTQSAQLDDCKQNTKKYKEEVNKAKSKVAEFEKQAKKTDGFTKIGTDAKKSATETQKATAKIQKSINSQVKKQNALKEKLSEVTEATETNLKAQVNAFEKFDGGTKKTFAEMQKNLASNKKGVENWGKNLKILSKNTSSEFIDAMRAMGKDSANIVAELAKQPAKKQKEFAKSYMDLYGKTIPNAVKDSTSNITKKIDEIGEKIKNLESMKKAAEKQAKDFTDTMSSKLASNLKLLNSVVSRNGESTGKYYGDGLASGMESKIQRVKAAAKKLSDAAHVTTNKNLEINSPSRKARRSGQWYGEGLALGTEDKVNRVKKAVGTLSKAMSINPNSASYGMSVNVNNQARHTNNDNVDLVNATVNAVLNRFAGFAVVMDGEKVGNFVDTRVSKKLRGV